MTQSHLSIALIYISFPSPPLFSHLFSLYAEMAWNSPKIYMVLMWTIITQRYTCLVSCEMSQCNWYKGLIPTEVNQKVIRF